MAYKSLSVAEAVQLIHSHKLFLPALQRNFVWNRKKIEQYFDSLYHGFPLGNFIFWNLDGGLADKYPLYKFVEHYNERVQEANPKPPRNLLNGDGLFGVVDGQQRLSSLFIGLSGTYKFKKAGKGKKDIDHNFVSSHLYFNLFASVAPLDQDGEKPQLFSFKEKEDTAHVSDKSLWIEVGKILNFKNANDITACLKSLSSSIQKTGKRSLIQRFASRYDAFKSALIKLHKQLHDPMLSYFEFVSHDIDDVIDVFVRVNSGGMQLKKADLLFSTIAAEWNDAKDEIDSLIKSLEQYDLFVDRDFVMRLSLMLCDLPIKYKIETFSKKNIKVIVESWDQIKSSALKLSEYLNLFGYKNLSNVSNSALLPIAYYISKGGDVKTQTAIKDIKRYYVTAQVKNIFGGQNDIILNKLRESLRLKSGKEYSLQCQKFDFEKIRNLELPIRKSFKIDKQYIEEELAEERYGANAYFLLSLLYPAFDFKMKRYELDHIHPKHKMNTSNLKAHGFNESDTNWILEHYDYLPNIELLTSEDNIAKKAKPFKDFIGVKNRSEKARFVQENFIPVESKLWGLEGFKEFYECRRKAIVKKLVKEFS